MRLTSATVAVLCWRYCGARGGGASAPEGIAIDLATTTVAKVAVCRQNLDTATGIRTRVSAVRGRRPSPLDDSGAEATHARADSVVEASKRTRTSGADALSSPVQRLW